LLIVSSLYSSVAKEGRRVNFPPPVTPTPERVN